MYLKVNSSPNGVGVDQQDVDTYSANIYQKKNKNIGHRKELCIYNIHPSVYLRVGRVLAATQRGVAVPHVENRTLLPPKENILHLYIAKKNRRSY